MDNSNFITIPCQNCGKPVQVLPGFIGCVFCSECMRSTGWMAGTESLSITDEK